MEPGEYQVRKYTFDRDHGALYTKWLNLNSSMDWIWKSLIISIDQAHPELRNI